MNFKFVFVTCNSIFETCEMDEVKKLTIKDWNADDRPREKLLKKGISALSDAELLTILISTGTRNQSALDLARAVLSSVDNNLHLLGKRTVADLMKINGIGEAKAISIISALELGRRRRNSDLERAEIKGSSDVFAIMQPILADLPHEEFWVLFLNRANRVIDKVCVSRGGVSGTMVDVKIVMKLALERLASSLILVHNHPSGNTNVSAEDRKITKMMQDASSMLDIKLLDHLVVADNRFVSFADDDML